MRKYKPDRPPVSIDMQTSSRYRPITRRVVRCLAALAVLVFLVFTFSFARPAAAMSIRVSRRPLAWSVDGSKLLAVEVQDGPEGGGSLTYLVVSASAPHYLRFEVSSDFSPGGGGTPQKISSKACRAAMARLARLVTRRQFPASRSRPPAARARTASIWCASRNCSSSARPSRRPPSTAPAR